MKSTLYSLFALLGVALIGSFLGLWKLPYQEKPYTYHDFSARAGKHFFNDGLREARDESRLESEQVFAVDE